MNELERFPRPSVTIDLILMSLSGRSMTVLLQLRSSAPFEGLWALPGGFVHIDESLDDAAARILVDNARLKSTWVEQLYSFGAPERDPRGRVITVAYFALVPAQTLEQAVRSASDLTVAKLKVPWPGEAGGSVFALGQEGEPLSLAFDHAEILGMAVKRLRGKLAYTKIAFALLPPLFTLRELQNVHEAILDQSLNKPAFRRRLLDRGWMAPTGERESGTVFRPAELYRVVTDRDAQH
ncbi:MAG: NUDIX domain-containing protein [Pseudomonadota bacterium]